MNRAVLTLVALSLPAVLAACGSGADPAGPGDGVSASATSDPPTVVPALAGEVTGVGTVLDTDGPRLCLGAVAESYPPQCDGLPMDGWDWASVPGTFEETEGARWGAYAVTGTFDGTTFTLTQAPLSAALYDPVAPPVTEPPAPAEPWDTARAEEVTVELGELLPGYLGSFPDGVLVRVDVVADDGSLQGWVDATYGEGHVVVSSALR